MAFKVSPGPGMREVVVIRSVLREPMIRMYFSSDDIFMKTLYGRHVIVLWLQVWGIVDDGVFAGGLLMFCPAGFESSKIGRIEAVTFA